MQTDLTNSYIVTTIVQSATHVTRDGAGNCQESQSFAPITLDPFWTITNDTKSWKGVCASTSGVGTGEILEIKNYFL